jgi:hypothetical protein
MPGGQEARDKCRGWILEAIQEMLKVDIRESLAYLNKEEGAELRGIWGSES